MSTDSLPTEPIKLSEEIDQHHYLQLILGAIPVGVIVVDKNFIIQAVNKAAETLIGIDGTEAIGHSYDEIMQSQDGPLSDPLEEAFVTGQSFVNQRFYVRPGSDNAFPIRHSAAVLRDEAGEIISGVTIFADISTQTRLQNQVEDQRRYLQDVLRSIPDGVVITDADLIIEIWNEAAVKITGRPASETIGKSCLEILGPTLATALRSILENGTQVLLDEETLLPVVDGHSLPVSFSADTIFSPNDDRVRGGIITFRDVSERLQRTRELAQQRRYLREVLDLAPYGIFTVDRNMVIQTFNKAAETLTGFAASFAVGKHYNKIIKIDPDSGLDPLSASITTSGQSATVRLRLLDATGKKLPVRYSASPLTDADENLVGSIIIFDDIGDIIAAERTKNEFFSMVSHELRTPLTSIKGFVTAVLEERVGSINEKQQHFLEIARQQSDLLLTLINDLLDLSRLESGKVEVNTNRINISELIDRAAQAITPLAQPKHLDIDIRIAPNLPYLWADENKIFQVLQNLLSNAVKFTPPEGKIGLKVEMFNDDRFVISVADSGVGIPPEEQERVFDPFYQVEDIHTRQVGGTGLGLPIVKNIIEEHHGGRIELESEVGVGSTFRLYLPRTRADNPAVWKQPEAETAIQFPAVAAAIRPKPERKNPLILVVDDDPSVNTLIQFTLEEEGYDVITATNAQEALRLATKRLPDLITLDVLMPEMDGFHVLDLLKKNPDTAPIPVCVVSIVEDKVKGYRLGAIDYVSKPFEREQLLQAVNNIIQPLEEGEHLQILIVEDDPNIIELVAVSLYTSPSPRD